MRVKNTLLFFCFFSFLTLLSSCQLVFEPADKAIDRLFASFVQAYPQVARDFTENSPDILPQLEAAGSIIASEWYNAGKDYYQITGIEKVEDTGMYFIYVDVRIPRNAQEPILSQWVFEMKREKLRWHIYSLSGVDEFVRRATQYRGIL